ncbi:50S ribosomal protein L10 [Cerasicoccus arenae]|uniref:Large ribosomal subunit protein uL10 n=1 Tax=Cerasicoccus arenae TaxID=424488 RepID=A0A8J3DEI4_9BACT|nr:50S ribosomal protein L10 [Cerasicoccus arenae]MBK1859467.1 50S ribosomal protein L10 [Cerasicoccus arenae]GHC10989.1 50S ribosomal protein L10 [Cerasicoccus arenae]
MRPEKKYLVQEVSEQLAKSEYVFLTDFNRLTVAETAELRGQLAAQNAEFHVVKNSILNTAIKEREMPCIEDALDGPTAIVVGGPNPSEVAKVLIKFFKDREKVEVKKGVLGDKTLTKDEVEALSKLPSLDELRATFLSLLNTPATQMVRVLIATPQGILNVLQAKADKDGGAE